MRRNPINGVCAKCGGDWDSGSRDQPAYRTCACPEADADTETKEEHDDNLAYLDATGSEL